MDQIQINSAIRVGDVTLRDLEIGDADWLIQQHGALYASDYGFDMTFESHVAQVLAAFILNRDLDSERAWIAIWSGHRLGSIFCMQEDANTARLRLFLLVPEARGLGLGKRLLLECLSFAKECGYEKIALGTHKSHSAARKLYASQGFKLANSKPVRSFGVNLIEENWEREL